MRPYPLLWVSGMTVRQDWLWKYIFVDDLSLKN